MTNVPPGDGGSDQPPPPPPGPPPPPPPGAYPPPGQQWAPPGYGQQPWQQSPYGGTPLGAQRPKMENGLGVAALVLGILAVLSGWIIVGGVLGILAVIFGIIGIRKANRGRADNKGMAIGGLVTGLIGIAISIFVVVVVATSDEVDTFIECLQEAETDEDREQRGEDFGSEFDDND